MRDVRVRCRIIKPELWNGTSVRDNLSVMCRPSRFVLVLPMGAEHDNGASMLQSRARRGPDAAALTIEGWPERRSWISPSRRQSPGG
jgi:hypothetical protein